MSGAGEVSRCRDEILASLPDRLIEIPLGWAAATPDAPVVHCGPATWTYADLAEGIEAVRVFLGRAGVRPGDRVVLVMENGFAALCAFYAITAHQAWAVMANARLSAREIAVVIERSDARFAIHTSGDSEDARAHAEAAGADIHEDRSFGELALAHARRDATPEPAYEDPARQIAAMIFTSGTTGQPKGAMLSHRTILYQSALVAGARFAAGDCAYVVAPMVHILGLAGLVMPLIYAGAAFEFATRFDIEAVLAGLASGHLTQVFGAPPMFASLLAHAEATGTTIKAPRLKQVLAGGSPVDEALREAAGRVFGMPLSTGYAATEFSPIATTPPGEKPNPGATGKPWPGVELRLVGRDGKEVPAGEVGEVQCRGPSAMTGYFRDPEATAATIDPDGWVSIGDLARLDGDGQVHIVGRLKELIIRSGFNVYPAEIEDVLSGHADVALSAVVGREVAGNEEVIAFVEPGPGRELDIPSVAAFAAGRLAPYKRPARIVVLDALPIGPTGKLDKIALKDRARALVD